MGNYDIITTPTYREFTINAGSGKPCRSDMLDGIIGLFEDAFATRNRNMFIRFDLTMPEDMLFPDPAEHFRVFIDSFIKNRRREGHDPHLFWCREQNPGRLSPHWHIAMLVSCRHTLGFMSHLDVATVLWGKRFKTSGKGLVDYCTRDKDGNPQRNGIVLDMGDPGFASGLEYCVRWASYLAKTRSKGNSGLDNTREWGRSQMRSSLRPQLWQFLPLPDVR